ncbi:Uncharacterised protein [Yersinia frederiksenii]|nr:Uncharacterised protein [Yersinia frederiksenii]
MALVHIATRLFIYRLIKEEPSSVISALAPEFPLL